MPERINHRTTEHDKSVLPVHETATRSEYQQILDALNKTGILGRLPESENLGIIGIDGKEYPEPKVEEVLEVFNHNRELVEAKQAQGFTKLQITPLATPLSILLDITEREILKHAREGKIFQTKRHPSYFSTPTCVDTDEPVLVWHMSREAINTNSIVYFPEQFEVNHQGKTKLEVISDPNICPIPGWSIGLVEDMPVLPQTWQGKTIKGRKQLETNLTPKDYLRILQSPAYQGETGWTYEDLLTDFLVNLHNTNQVSHEWFENSSVWLLGSYLPNAAYVPFARWDRDRGQLYVYAYEPDYKHEYWGARSTVRLGI